jgi:type IV pilus assembly protein PilE
MSHQRGFTLVEILIAMALAVILLMIALPSFQESIRKTRRSDAVNALAQIQQAQERWRANNLSYSSNLAALGLASNSTGGLYTLTLSNTGPTSYTATATANASTSQAGDERCIALSVTLAAGNLSYTSMNAQSQVDTTNANRCWAR